MRNLLLLLPFLTIVALATFTRASAPPVAAPPVTSAAAPSVAPAPLPNVQLKFSIKRNGLVVSHPQVQVELNHTAVIIQQEAKNPYHYKIEVTPSIDPSSAIHLECRISEVSDEETVLLSTPNATVFAGDSTDVTQKKAHSDEIKITITPSLLN